MTSPYVGPKPFARQSILYGRDQEIEELRWRIVADRILVLYSPSGAGKTSVMGAKNGLLRRMRDRFTVLPVLRVLGSQTEKDISEVNCITLSLLTQLEHAGYGGVKSGDDLLRYFSRIELKNRRRPRRLLLVIDQAEEIFTSAADPSQQKEFFQQLGALLAREENPVWFVLSMREEYFSWLDPFRELVRTRLANTFRLNPMSVEQAVKAIKGPVPADVKWPEGPEGDAAEKLAKILSVTKVRGRDSTVTERPGTTVEPVQLQVLCDDLWRRIEKDGPVHSIDPGRVDKADLSTALELYCDSVLDKVAREPLRGRILRTWIVTRVLTRDGFRTQAEWNEQEKISPDSTELKALIDAHLLRKLPSGDLYELSHDSLAAPVRKSIDKWMTANSEPWQRLARSWHAGGRSPAFIKAIPFADLSKFPRKDEANSPIDDEVEFLDAAQEHLSRKKKFWAAGVLLFCMVVGLLAELAYTHQDKLRNQAQLLLIRDVVAKQAALMTIQGDDPNIDLAARAALAGVALKEDYPAVVAFDFRTVLTELFNKARQIERVETVGDGSSTRVVSSERHRAVYVFGEKRWRISVTDAATGKPAKSPDTGQIELAHPGGLRSVIFMRDGRMVTAGLKGEFAVWDIASSFLAGQFTPTVAQIEAQPLGSKMRGDVRVLATAGDLLFAGYADKVVGVWKIGSQAGTAELLSAVPAQSIVSALVPLEGGTRLAVADLGENEEVIVYSLKDGKFTGEKKAFPVAQKELDWRGSIYSIAISPDGKTLIAGTRAGKIHFWELFTGKYQFALPAHQDNVAQLRYLKDGRLLSAGWDGELKLWSNLAPGGKPSSVTLLELPRQLDGLAWKIVDESVTVSTEKGDVLEVSLLPMRHPLGQVLAVDPKAAAALHHSGTVLSVITAHSEFVKTHNLDVVQGRTLPGVTSNLAGISAFAWASQPGLLYAAKGNTIWTMRPGESTPIPLIGTGLPVQLDVVRLASNADGSLLMALMKSNTASTYWLTKVWAIDRKDGIPKIRCDVALPEGFPIKESAIFSFRPHHPELVTARGAKVALWSFRGTACPVLAKSGSTFFRDSQRGEFTAVAFDAAGTNLYTSNFAGAVLSVPIDGTQTHGLKAHSKSVVTSLAVGQRNGKDVVAIGEASGKLQVFFPDSKTAVPLAQQFHKGKITTLSLSPDANWLLSSDAQVTAIWDLRMSSWHTKACSLANDQSFSAKESKDYFSRILGPISVCGPKSTP